MATVTQLISPEEYLVLERGNETKHEYLDGQVTEMAGASKDHNLIVGNVIITIGSQLRGREGEVYPSDMRVRIPATGLYTYPDVTIVAQQPQFDTAEKDVLLNPTVIVEVLSESTESRDRGVKFQHYRTVESLTEYLLIAQDSYRVEHFVRQPDGQWLLSEATKLANVVILPTVDCELPLNEVYDKVEIQVNVNGLNGRHQ